MIGGYMSPVWGKDRGMRYQFSALQSVIQQLIHNVITAIHMQPAYPQDAGDFRVCV